MSKLALFLLVLSSCHVPGYSLDTARKSWVRVVMRVQFKPCAICATITAVIGGTAFFVESTEVPNAMLTVAHLCAPSFPGVTSIEVRAKSPEGHTYRPLIVRVDKAADLCLMSADKPWPHRVRLSRRPPKLGESVRYYGTPGAFFQPNIRPGVRGHYNGGSKRVDHYSLPVEGGASGSPIVRVDGLLVGVVMSRWSSFRFFSQSPSYDALRRFLGVR